MLVEGVIEQNIGLQRRNASVKEFALAARHEKNLAHSIRSTIQLF